MKEWNFEESDSDSPDLVDLAELHKAVRRSKPSVVLAFGGDDATITLAHAVAMNGNGRLYSVQLSEDHAVRIRLRMPHELIGVTTFLYAMAGNLPEVAPDMIYLGAGRAREAVNDNPKNPGLAAILHYEPMLRPGAVIVADTQIEAIVRGLKRRWKRRWSVLETPATFVLRK